MSNQANIGFDYPDLSDDDEEQEKQNKDQHEEKIPHMEPQKKIKTEEEAKKPINSIIPPLLFGGRAFIPPPPPPGNPQKKSSNNQQNSNSYQNQGTFNKNYGQSNYNRDSRQPYNSKEQYNSREQNSKDQYNSRDNTNNGNSTNKESNKSNNSRDRDRKGCVYVKNIPKHFNDAEKLMTFFKNQGPIKEIKPNQQNYTALVRFVKEEHAFKFVNSSKPIFNRSYIVYSLNEKQQIPAEFVKERENEESGKIKRPVELEIKQMKERLDTLLADKCRALLFLVNSIADEPTLQTLRAQLSHCKNLKESIPKLNEQECRQHSVTETNDYDWTLCFQLNRGKQIQKKHLIYEYQNKYGPTNTIELKRLNATGDNQIEEEKPGNEQQQSSQTFQYILKLNFLGLRHSWDFYMQNSSSIKPKEPSQSGERYMIEVQGSKMKALFNLGIIKPKEKPKKEELVYIPKAEISRDAKDEKTELMDRAAELFNVIDAQNPQADQNDVIVSKQLPQGLTPSLENNLMMQNMNIKTQMVVEGEDKKGEGN